MGGEEEDGPKWIPQRGRAEPLCARPPSPGAASRVNPAIPGSPGAHTLLSPFRSSSGRLQIQQIFRAGSRGDAEASPEEPPRLPIRLPGTEEALEGGKFPQRPEMFMAPASLPRGKAFIPEIRVGAAFLLSKPGARGLWGDAAFPFSVFISSAPRLSRWEQAPCAPRLAGMSLVMGFCWEGGKVVFQGGSSSPSRGREVGSTVK